MRIGKEWLQQNGTLFEDIKRQTLDFIFNKIKESNLDLSDHTLAAFLIGVRVSATLVAMASDFINEDCSEDFINIMKDYTTALRRWMNEKRGH